MSSDGKVAGMEEMDDVVVCGHVMVSGMTCVMPKDHEGHHFDRFGLRDPDPWVPVGRAEVEEAPGVE